MVTDAPAVVVVGAASRDLVHDDPRGWRLGGGVSYAALTLARLGLRVGALIGADRLAAESRELQLLREAGVEVAVARLDRGPVFINTETPAGRIQHAPQVSDPVEPSALPAGWRDAGGWLFGPVAAELPSLWADVPSPDALVALGWQGLLRVLVAGEPVTQHPPARSPIVGRADLVGVGRDDVDAATPEASLVALLRPGATMLLTDGAVGGIAVDVGPDGLVARRRTWTPIPVERFVDPVGAGDTFLAGVLAARIDPALCVPGGGPDADLLVGAAAASLACEGPGLLGVPTRDAVLRRMQAASAAD
jgi:sugar/nucleoside kinase (ribokinase family)